MTKRKRRKNYCNLSPDFDFRLCCAAHDHAYEHQHISRARADFNLAVCIGRHGLDRGFWNRVIHWLLAPCYLIGVRVGGWYSWSKCRAFLCVDCHPQVDETAKPGSQMVDLPPCSENSTRQDPGATPRKD